LAASFSASSLSRPYLGSEALLSAAILSPASPSAHSNSALLHPGLVEVYLCDKADALSQDCLNKHLLLRDPNDPSISPVDPNFPGRYYMIPTCYGAAASMNQTARYKLPATLDARGTVVLVSSSERCFGNPCRGD
jgi:hypothetical protein